MLYRLTREENIRLLESYKKTLITNPGWLRLLYERLMTCDEDRHHGLIVAGYDSYRSFPLERSPFGGDMKTLCEEKGIDIRRGLAFNVEIWEEMNMEEFIITLYQATHL